MSRSRFIVTAVLAALSFSGLLQAAEPVTIRLGDVKGDRYASLRASGELENLDYKVELTPFAAGAPVLEALNANALDVGFTGDIPFLFVHAAGAQLKAVGAWRYNTATVALVVPKDSAAQNVSDLKGKRIAVNRGGWGHFLALGLLEKNGLTDKDVTFSFLGPVDGRAALVRGSVDAWVPWEPYTSNAILIDGARVIGDGRGIMSGYSYALASEKALADADKKAAIGDLLIRLAKAQQWALAHPQQMADALSEDLNIPQNVARRWVEEARIQPAALDEEVATSLQKAADFFHRHGVLPKQLDVQQAFDFSLAGDVRKAIAEDQHTQAAR
ncbi:aliphatic sulfonates ABC transporter substrate-binding protein [Pseudomonas daroniae]|uniref:Putative aliphatic sulfonates-binding protein n=1 Tax=Phytopseudomonas daroniae TaxID=2487519 RepID=A0A4Q9QJC5_9GAMM|nr:MULTISPECIES: ABC transporter substrate-binding protein [Pseudomonas]TBU73805.1 aliphatic sulfonates ABC transporter substrate-binding protein [Pseudomonas daroniae]TBU79556.1 aliphatic sulfonates ABC transporter substrate-binding protein [Pseudomonas sp. FRB 228]TBU88249.1 aliphatic sulfonates ABC transporter substrate-binding protein [Pseudomonas daroniae]